MKNILTNPIIVGGILPFFMYGLCASVIKMVNLGHFSKYFYLVLVGMGVITVGVLGIVFEKDLSFSSATLQKDIILSVLVGIFWGIGSLAIFIALSKLGANLSQIAPIFNANSVLAVLVSILFFAEKVDVLHVSIATILMVIAGVLVSI